MASKHVLDEVVEGFPDSLNFEPMIAYKDETDRYYASIKYDLTFDGPQGHNVYLVIGQRIDLNDGVICSEKELREILPLKDSKIEIKSVVLNGLSPVSLKGTYKIVEDNLYSFFIVSCEKENYIYKEDRQMTVTGHVDFINPFGYLPAHKYPLIDMYFIFMFIYIILIGFWYALCMNYKENLVSYHYFITLVMIFAVFEMLLHTIDVLEFNTTGLRLHIIYFFAKMFQIARRVLSRALIILVCNGIGIIKSKAEGGLKRALIVLSTVYAGASLLLEFSRDFKVKGEVTIDTMILSFILSSIDASFFAWTFVSLYESINSLGEEEKHKKSLFWRFSAVISLGCLIAIVFSLMQINYVREKRWLEVEGWHVYWIYDAGFSEFLSMYFLCAIFCVMNPKNSKIADYTQLTTAVDIESKGEKLTAKDSGSEGSEDSEGSEGSGSDGDFSNIGSDITLSEKGSGSDASGDSEASGDSKATDGADGSGENEKVNKKTKKSKKGKKSKKAKKDKKAKDQTNENDDEKAKDQTNENDDEKADDKKENKSNDSAIGSSVDDEPSDENGKVNDDDKEKLSNPEQSDPDNDNKMENDLTDKKVNQQKNDQENKDDNNENENEEEDEKVKKNGKDVKNQNDAKKEETEENKESNKESEKENEDE